LIFSLYTRVLVKLGDERHVFDRSQLMYTEVREIQKVTGQSYGEWQQDLGRYDIGAVAALLHVLRKRDGVASDYKTMEFAAADLDVIPLHDDGAEFTAAEVAADLAKRAAEAEAGPGPTPAAAGQDAAQAENSQTQRTSTNPSSPNGSTSGPGNGTASPKTTISVAKASSTRS